MKRILYFCLFLLACQNKPMTQQDAGTNSNNQPDTSTNDLGSDVKVTCMDFEKQESKSMTMDIPCDWEKLENANYDFVFKHNETKTLITIKEEKFDTTYDHFVLSKLRTLRNSNVKVEDIDETKIGDVNFLFVSSEKEDVEAWHFFGWKNNVGYSITCGGQKESMSKDQCQKIFNSIKIK